MRRMLKNDKLIQDANGNLVAGGTTTLENLQVDGDTTTTGDVAIGGDLTITGDAKILENITDADGNKRFIDIEGTDLEAEGFTLNYKKASLSGTHLMMVAAGQIAAGTVINTNFLRIVSYDVPGYVYNKCYPTIPNTVGMEVKSIDLFDENGNAIQKKAMVIKEYNKLYLCIYKSTGTISDDVYFRFQFDLLIDNQ